MSPFITVVVPVRNEERYLADTLRPLLEQQYDPGRYEILVVDGQSTDDTPGVVQRLQVEHPQINLLDNQKRLSSAARNVGIRAARGEYVVIVDGHCELRSLTYLRDLASAFERSGADCLGRPQPLEVASASPVQQAIALARASRLGHNPGSHIYSDLRGFVKPQSVAVAYRRSVFDRVGLFDETFDACEDVEFNTRIDAAGLSCYFAPELAVNYHPRETLSGLVFQMGRYGRGRARLAFKNPASLTLPAMVPALFLTGLAAAFVLGLAAPLFAAVFCGTALVYSGVVAIVGLWLAVQRGAAGLSPLFPAVFLAIHVGAGWGVLAELVPGVLRRSFGRVRPVARALRPT